MTGLRLIASDLYWVYRKRRMVTALVESSVQRRYFGMALGQLWGLLNFITAVAIMATLYTIVLGLDYHVYVPHMALGFLIWETMTGQINESCNAIKVNLEIAKEFAFPPMLYFVVGSWTASYFFIQRSFIIILLLLWLQGISLFSPVSLLALPGLALTFTATYFIAMGMGIISTVFRDVVLTLNSLFRVAFLATPIIWMPGMRGIPQWVSDINPFYHMIEVVRAPLLHKPVAPMSYLVVILIAAGAIFACSLVYVRFKRNFLLWAMK